MSHSERRAPAYPRLVLPLLVLLLVTAGCEVNVQPPTTPCTVCAAIQWGNPDGRIDVVFIPDDGYGDLSVAANLSVFLADISNMIDEGFWQSNALANNLGAFNFWYMTTAGDVQPPAAGVICPTVTWPNLADAAFAETFVMLHTNDLRDCSSGNRFTSEPTSYRTVVHEFSHAGFGLPDEYCCDGGYWAVSPILYDTQAACTGDPANAAWRNCQSFTSGSGNDWWRSEDSIVDIMSQGGAVVCEYGPADWVVARGVLSGLGLSTADPSVYAPDPWDWP